MKDKHIIIHYRFKTSEVAHHYRLAKDYEINPDKLIKERMNIACYPVQHIAPDDIFPRGGVTVVVSEATGHTVEAVCSLKDNYNRARGVTMCTGRMCNHRIYYE